MEDTDKTGDKIFEFVQGEKEIFNDFGNSLKKTVKQVTVFQEKMAEGFVNREDEMPVGTVDQLKGHSSRPVIGIPGSAGGAELGVAPERDELKPAAVWASIHGAAIRRVATVNDFFNVFHNNGS